MHGPTPALGDDHRTMSREERSRRTAELLGRAQEATGPERDDLLAEVVLVNRRVADAVANRYRRRGIPLEDLQQVAYEGLVKAVSRFDPTVRDDLLTYAVPTIRGEIQRHFRDQGWMVRPPRRVQELQRDLTMATDRLEQELGREPTDEEVERELGITPEEHREALQGLGCFQPTSLDQPVGNDAGTSLGEVLPQEPDEGAAEARAMLAPVMRGLSERDKRVLYLRFYEDQTQREIGDELGVSQVQVSRVLTRILETMREQIGAEHPPAP
ncbi:sigma-70 family RNA polymerase sigma factor [Nocardioides sp. SOB77]|uniref:Sigma-70 family RNA polymerase sigma factor n=1 Tax=Nocardioides oceani TaxID=3058369 RepID=A0ABT8FD67_9ACTN|nr:sigma-70 family RNA polymerase sigma factor [Nocardioides oceani]MDN4172636.1 sigma-70 family RNA polymerase sigma factor [Nocardioides oceani]